jgi:hypothetical protein
MESRLIRTRRGFRVLGGACLTEPISLPPPSRLTAEEIWAALCEVRQERYAEALQAAACPPGARLIPLHSPHRPLFAIVDEADYAWLSRYSWAAWTQRGYKHARAVATIDGYQWQMPRLILHVGHRHWRVRLLNRNPLDYRRCNLKVEAPQRRAKGRSIRTPCA